MLSARNRTSSRSSDRWDYAFLTKGPGEELTFILRLPLDSLQTLAIILLAYPGSTGLAFQQMSEVHYGKSFTLHSPLSH